VFHIQKEAQLARAFDHGRERWTSSARLGSKSGRQSLLKKKKRGRRERGKGKPYSPLLGTGPLKRLPIIYATKKEEDQGRSGVTPARIQMEKKKKKKGYNARIQGGTVAPGFERQDQRRRHGTEDCAKQMVGREKAQ